MVAGVVEITRRCEPDMVDRHIVKRVPATAAGLAYISVAAETVVIWC